MRRKEILLSLIKYDRNLQEIEKDISLLSWDSDTELARLTRNNITNILSRYMKNEINDSELERWAELIESREDIGVELESKDFIDAVVFSLANPTLTFSNGKIDKENILSFLTRSHALRGNTYNSNNSRRIP